MGALPREPGAATRRDAAALNMYGPTEATTLVDHSADPRTQMASFHTSSIA